MGGGRLRNWTGERARQRELKGKRVDGGEAEELGEGEGEPAGGRIERRQLLYSPNDSLSLVNERQGDRMKRETERERKHFEKSICVRNFLLSPSLLIFALSRLHAK